MDILTADQHLSIASLNGRRPINCAFAPARERQMAQIEGSREKWNFVDVHQEGARIIDRTSINSLKAGFGSRKALSSRSSRWPFSSHLLCFLFIFPCSLHSFFIIYDRFLTRWPLCSLSPNWLRWARASRSCFFFACSRVECWWWKERRKVLRTGQEVITTHEMHGEEWKRPQHNVA